MREIDVMREIDLMREMIAMSTQKSTLHFKRSEPGKGLKTQSAQVSRRSSSHVEAQVTKGQMQESKDQTVRINLSDYGPAKGQIQESKLLTSCGQISADTGYVNKSAERFFSL